MSGYTHINKTNVDRTSGDIKRCYISWGIFPSCADGSRAAVIRRCLSCSWCVSSLLSAIECDHCGFVALFMRVPEPDADISIHFRFYFLLKLTLYYISGISQSSGSLVLLRMAHPGHNRGS